MSWNFKLFIYYFLAKFFLKATSGIENSADPDQIALSGSALFAYAILFSEEFVYEILGQLL